MFVHTRSGMQWLENNLKESFLSHHRSSRNWTQVTSLDSKHLYLLKHLASPDFSFVRLCLVSHSNLKSFFAVSYSSEFFLFPSFLHLCPPLLEQSLDQPRVPGMKDLLLLLLYFESTHEVFIQGSERSLYIPFTLLSHCKKGLCTVISDTLYLLNRLPRLCSSVWFSMKSSSGFSAAVISRRL